MPAFSLEQARRLSLATVRVTFTDAPKVSDATAVDDGLNPTNYVITGPATEYVTGVIPVDTDPLSVDLTLAAIPAVGTWTVSVSNVKSASAASLSAPTSKTFSVLTTAGLESLGKGAKNESSVNIVRRFLNPAFKGRAWDSMIAAVAAGNQINQDNAALAFDQLFLSTARGAYLKRRASDEGVEYPRGVNMADELFRQLAITQKTRKLSQESFLEVLEVFYGADAVRASATTEATESYDLDDGDDLQVLLDERRSVTVTFRRSHFVNISAASALEVAAAITRDLRDAGTEAYAVALQDPIMNVGVVRIYSGALGLTSSVRVTGGRANTQLLFPTSLFEASGGSPFAGWTVTLSPTTPGNLRFTMSSGTLYDLFLVREGDLAYVYGPEFAACNSNGTFVIERVSVTYSGITKVQWFEIQNPLGVAAGPISQTGFTDLMFFRPTRRTIYDVPRHVVVAQNADWVDVSIPATTLVVGRGPGTAAYLNVRIALQVSSLVRTPDGVVAVTTATPHDLAVGDQVLVDSVLPTGAVPPTTAGTPSVNYAANTATGTTDASIRTTVSQTGTFEGVYHRVVRLATGELMVVGGQTQVDAVTIAARTDVAIFKKDGEVVLGNGGRQQTYRWTRFTGGGAPLFNNYHIGQRSFHASLLEDGRVLATGGAVGDDATGTPNNGWDLLTYSSPNVLQSFGTLPAARASHAQASLAGGDAFISGGWTVAGTMLATTLRFAVATQTWSAKASMLQARMHHEMVPVGVKVLAIGGQTATKTLATCELYDVAGNTWATTGSMSVARTAFGVLKLPDGRVLVVGGVGYNPTQSTTPATLNTCEVYDSANGLWTPMPKMRFARDYPIVSYLATKNAVIVAGGTGVTAVERLDLATMHWTTHGALAATHVKSAGGITSTDTFLVSGGLNGNATEKVNFVEIPGADTFWDAGGLNRVARVETAPSGNTFTYKTADGLYGDVYTTAAAGATVTRMAAAPAPAGVPGPFIYDLKDGLSITAVTGATDTVLNKGQHYASVHLDTSGDPNPALQFPDAEGFLSFNFGFASSAGPVRYFGRLSNEDLILDAAAAFPATIPAGAVVRLLAGRVPFQPEPDELVGNFYVTGTAAGRIAAQKTIDDIEAAGKDVLVTVIYPGDRGLGAEGFPQRAAGKLSDKVAVWGGDSLDTEIPLAREGA